MEELFGGQDTSYVDTTRGGPHLGELIEQTRALMDRVRVLCPTDEQAVEATRLLKELNGKLDAAVVDEWSTPGWTRHDIPARGNICLPEYTVTKAEETSAEGTMRFRQFHLGGNSAAHGGQVGVFFDDVMGFAAARAAHNITRTAYLTVNYRSITPLNTPLTFRIWADRIEGRKVYVRGSLHNGDTLCAEADALMIALRPNQA